jgi:ferric-dicitrate binding protein FerR (iron transport regulator)
MNEDKNHIEIDLLTRSLTGEANQEELELVRHWTEASEANRKQYEEFMKVLSAAEKTSKYQNIDIEAEWSHHINTYIPSVAESPSGKIFKLATVFKVAASVLLIISFSYFGWRYMSQKSVKTSIAETNEITLPDGSKVTINARSKLTYHKKDFGKTSRIVSLEGEAFFEVQKNPALPFIIKLDGAEVKVLGTSFNVRAYKDMDKIEVTVAEGKVTLYQKGMEQKRVVVIKGEKAVFNKSLKYVQKQMNDDRNFISWKTRLIVFENDSLSTISRTLSNVYHKNFVIQNPKLNHCTVTTTFENKDLQTVLNVLKSTLDITIEEEDNAVNIMGKGC